MDLENGDMYHIDKPGTIEVVMAKRVGIVNMFSQFAPGHATEPDEVQGHKWEKEFREAQQNGLLRGPFCADATGDRLQWFKECLVEVGKKVPAGSSLALPHGIGCGHAGGSWDDYEKAILDFARSSDACAKRLRIVICESKKKE